MQLGVGYGKWWDEIVGYRDDGGYEFEAGLMLKMRHWVFNMTGNYLNGSKTYAAGDLCLGVGYAF